MSLRDGRYDRVVDRRLAATLDALGADREALTEQLDDADVPHRLARHVAEVVRDHLPDVPAAERAALVSRLVAVVGAEDRAVEDVPVRRLTAVSSVGTAPAPLPEIPLGQHDLLVNARGEPALASELKRELASADAVDLIVAFVRWTGVRLVIDELRAAVLRGARVRLLTTTYTGSTEGRALDELEDAGVEVRVSYDTAMTRLHAKSWQFHRDSGFGTAYVGSSNVTRSAMLDGREWNVRLSQDASPAVFDKLSTAFEAQWSSGDYQPYDAHAFAAAMRTQHRNLVAAETVLSGLEIRPWPYQAEILDALAAERSVRGSTRNLVVAPTGTGKTVVAALDYARLREVHGDLSVLFVAHRHQILTQSLRTFREVLGNGSFGELLVGGLRPEDDRHVFASIQTLSSGEDQRYAPDHFDVVIVDEFHHAEAATYRRLLDHLQPRWLLAMTATPERADGLDIRTWTDGRTAFDMRLWHALDRQLLTPFQYFGLADTTDFTALSWQRGFYDRTQLDDVLTGNDARMLLVLRAVERVVGDPRTMRALGFCATVEHAHECAAAFTKRGWPSVALDGSTPEVDRRHAIDRLKLGELSAIFTRDVFNEGIDIPQADTILLLRPTESVTVHLQQLGRGLRRHDGKDVCTVIDLVGQHRKEYRWDQRLRAMTGLARRDLADAAEHGFPFLPSGCHIELDRQSRAWVLDNLKTAVKVGRTQLRKELSLAVQQREDRSAPPLAEFVEDLGIDVEDVGKAGGWTLLQRAAGLDVAAEVEEEARLQRGVTRLLHVDDTDRIDTWSHWLSQEQVPTPTTDREQRLLWMLLVTLWSGRAAPDSFEEAAALFWRSAPLRDELCQTLAICRDRIARPTIPLDGLPGEGLAANPLHLHATYARDELLAGFRELYPGRWFSLQSGVWFNEASRTELLLVTLEKSEQHYSPETLYRDFAISRELFHWESPNDTTPTSDRGRRYVEQRTNGVRILLAVRPRRRDPWGSTAPYTLLGPAHYVEHTGERPIAITWRLANPIPADLYEDVKAAAA